MPHRPASPCTIPGCPALVARPGKCPAHQRAADRQLKANQPWRDYGHDWLTIRAQVLAEEPTCRRCGAPAVEVDHITPLRHGGARLDRTNLQPLCHPCHSAKTARDNHFGGDPSTR